jgi:signal peptidase II
LFLGLLLGGTLGNLTDRLFRTPGFPQGHVVDFISTPWMMPAIYNIADIAIVTSVGIFVIVSIRGIGIDGSRQTRVIKAETSEQ